MPTSVIRTAVLHEASWRCRCGHEVH